MGRVLLVLSLLGVGLLGVATGCHRPPGVAEPFRTFPNTSRFRDQEVWEAYRFAWAHQETLRFIPCFCGCVNHGHTSNRDCYLASPPGQERPVFEPHAAG